jgi:hypothetical protein
MTEQRAMRSFRGFDLPVDPEPAFASALYEELAAQLGFRPAPSDARPEATAAQGVPIAAPPRRPGRVLRPAWAARLGIGETAWRVAWVAAVVGLLGALVLGGVYVASLLGRPDPAALVERSRAAYREPPAFDMLFTDPNGTRWRMSADGEGTWRVDSPDPPGAYTLYDGPRTAMYDPGMETWGVMPAADMGGWPPYPLFNEFAWRRMVPDSDPVAFETVPCTLATWVASETVAGRPADHVRCADSDIDYWLDAGTGLVTRMRAGPTAPGWEGPMSGIVPVMEAVALETGPPDVARFAWDGPPGAYPADDPPVSTVLELGAVAPALEGRAVDGTPFTTAPGEPTAVLFTSRGGVGGTREAFDAAVADMDGVRPVVVQANAPGTVAGYLAGHPTRAAVVADPDQALGEAWGLNFTPALVLLDAEGRVVAIESRTMDETGIRAWLEALRADAPLPELGPEPVPTPWPEPSERIEGSSGGLGRWETPEPWSAPLAGGGTIDSADLAGRPAFVWFWFSELPTPTTGLVAFDLLARAYADRAAFVVVAMGEPEPGWLDGEVRRLGITVPVAYDWDGRVDTAFRVGTESTYLLAADGRLADNVDGVPGQAAAVRMLDRLAEGGVASPSAAP